jgi:hypothetical protein
MSEYICSEDGGQCGLGGYCKKCPYNEDVRHPSKQQVIEAMKSQRWDESYDLNSHQQSENRAIDRTIAVVEKMFR